MPPSLSFHLSVLPTLHHISAWKTASVPGKDFDSPNFCLLLLLCCSSLSWKKIPVTLSPSRPRLKWTSPPREQHPSQWVRVLFTDGDYGIMEFKAKKQDLLRYCGVSFSVTRATNTGLKWCLCLWADTVGLHSINTNRGLFLIAAVC